MNHTEILTHEDCLDFRDDGSCRGRVEFRQSLTGTGLAIERCDGHWAARLETEDRIRHDYPDSPFAPSWFDPADAGEVWDDPADF